LDETHELLRKMFLKEGTRIKFIKGKTFHLPSPYKDPIRVRKGEEAKLKEILLGYLYYFEFKSGGCLWLKEIPFESLEIMEET